MEGPTDSTLPAKATTGPSRIKKLALVSSALVSLVGADKEILVNECPKRDVAVLAHQGLTLMGGIIYVAASITLMAHKMLVPAGQFDLKITIAAVATGLLIGCLDALIFFRGTFFESGKSQIASDGGMKFPNAPNGLVKQLAKLALRLALSVPLSVLCGISLSLFVFQADVYDENWAAHLQRNQAITDQATQTSDAAIAHATKAVQLKETEIDSLSAQITALRSNTIGGASTGDDTQHDQGEIDALLKRKAAADDSVRSSETIQAREGFKGVSTARYRAGAEEVINAKIHARQIADELKAARIRYEQSRQTRDAQRAAQRSRSDRQIPAFEQKLDRANAELDGLQGKLKTLTAGRNDFIRTAVESSPTHIPFNNGFLAQISALDDIAARNRRVWWVTLLLECAAVSLELGAVFSKFLVTIPTDYAKIFAKRAIVRAIEIADEIEARNNKTVPSENSKDPEPPPPPPANDNEPGGEDEGGGQLALEALTSSPSPKRGRGRPRKPRLLH
jgi:Domain of unknown function (DUF4407)